jgi:large subunit ribosomal protein L11
MAKKILGYIKLQVKAGSATPSPPDRAGARAARRQHHGLLQGVQRAHLRDGEGHAAADVITVYQDKSFTFVTKTPPRPTI